MYETRNTTFDLHHHEMIGVQEKVGGETIKKAQKVELLPERNQSGWESFWMRRTKSSS